MSIFTLFILLALVLLYVAFLFLVPIVARSNYETRVQGDSLNKKLYQEKLQELEADLSSGDIEQEEYDEALEELKKQLLQDSKSNDSEAVTGVSEKRFQYLIAVMLVLPMAATGLYVWLGEPGSLAGGKSHPAFQKSATAGTNNTNNRIAINDRKAKTLALIKQMEQRLKEHPDEPKTLLFLARAYQSIAMFRKASEIYKKVLPNFKDDADVLAEYADALAVVHGGTISGKSMELIEQALKVNPKHIKALHLAGTAHYRKGEYQIALGYWKRLLDQAPKNSAQATEIQSIIAETEHRINNKTPPLKSASTATESATTPVKSASTATESATTPAKSENQSTDSGSTEISGQLTLQKSFVAGSKPEQRVFIFARAVNGPKMPLAAIKIAVKDLPYNFKLSALNAMSPAFRLQPGQDVIIIARVSKTGDAIAKPGDIEGQSKPVKVGSAEPVNIVINKTIPIKSVAKLPESGSTKSPESGSSKLPDSNSTKSPESGSAKSPESGSTKSPESGSAKSPESGSTKSPESDTTAINGQVTIKKSLLSGIKPEQVVYIFARAVNGPKMPLAAIRVTVKDLPYNYKLSALNAMSPAFRLQSGQEVTIIARITKTGDVIAKPGDLEGHSKTFKVGSGKPVNIVIDQTIK